MTKIGFNTWLNPVNYNMIPDKYNLTRIIKKSCVGNDAKELQKIIRAAVDGIFDSNTLLKLKAF